MQCTHGSLAVQGQDLVSGNLTAPAVFALQHPQYGAELEGLIQNEFDGGSSFSRALDLVHLGGGIQAARHLARQEADMVSRLPFWKCYVRPMAKQQSSPAL